MTSRDFCYWLQGALELSKYDDGLSIAQVEIIQNHLNMVFIHEIDPSFPEEQKADLSKAHGGQKPKPGLEMMC